MIEWYALSYKEIFLLFCFIAMTSRYSSDGSENAEPKRGLQP